MPIGTIKFFSDRGFGFLTRDDGLPDVFVHSLDLKASGLPPEPEAGQRFEFSVIKSPRNGREAAVDLKPAD